MNLKSVLTTSSKAGMGEVGRGRERGFESEEIF
jgi:hypothetical protein